MALTLPMRGGCICGNIRYEVIGHPLIETMCHCTTCQKRTGSAFSMNLLVMKPDFSVTHGKTVTRDLPTGSGKVNVQHFCNDCLVRTHTEPVALPTIVYVRPGTLDDPKVINPGLQIWTRSALPWALRPDTAGYECDLGDDARELIRVWREANPVCIGD